MYAAGGVLSKSLTSRETSTVLPTASANTSFAKPLFANFSEAVRFSPLLSMNTSLAAKSFPLLSRPVTDTNFSSEAFVMLSFTLTSAVTLSFSSGVAELYM